MIASKAFSEKGLGAVDGEFLIKRPSVREKGRCHATAKQSWSSVDKLGAASGTG
jgi:hypothetical protein